MPKAADPRLVVEPFAAAPDIVHPIALDFDKKGRLLVIESHTHFRPPGYKGPPHDRIRVVEDTDGDGKADRFTTFFEGTKATMDLAVHPDGSVYIATRNEILRLRDTDGDGKADEKQRIVFLDTKGDYPHNGLSGLCFDAQGNLYFGMGENLGASYKVIGSDGATISGEGDGGHIFWCTADGRKLRKVATGFWNPFGVCRDSCGRLFAVDNDPDSMPPCRLLHIVEGGDYGYQFRYGRSGRHPFQAWDGQLPGTLPMMAGTGEAPCEVLSYDSDGLPSEYRGQLLVTSWADHRIERYELKPRGASWSAERKPFVQGGSEFRPVGLAVAPDGSLFASDWVRRDYNLHGQGAIWHIRAKDARKPGDAGSSAGKPHSKVARPAKSRSAARLLREAVDADPFIRHAAIRQLGLSPQLLIEADRLPDVTPRQRVALLLAWRASRQEAGTTRLRAALASADHDLRLLAAKWIADEKLTEYRPHVEAALADRTLNVTLYHALATTLARLDGKDVNESRLNDLFVARLLDPATPAETKAQLLRVVPTAHPKVTPSLLDGFTRAASPALRLEAVRALAEHPHPDRVRLLRSLLKDGPADATLRSFAVVGLADRAGELRSELVALATTASDSARDEALRALVNVELTAEQRAQLEALAKGGPESKALVARLLGREHSPGRAPSADSAAWLKRLEGPADPAVGRRLFFHARLAGCYRCHRAEGRGQDIGPDLSAVGRNGRARILDSILRPSEEVAPHYQVWNLATADGKVRTGMLLRTYLDEYTYLDAKGEQFKLRTTEIESSEPSPKSIMPDGLPHLFTDQELRDLLAYLESLR